MAPLLSRLPMWGRIVDASTAAGCSKGTLVDLGDNAGAGPRLFLDGSNFVSFARSDCCVAFMAPPLPKPKVLVAGKKVKKPPVPTHKLEFESFSVELHNGCTCTYKKPFLVDNADHRDVVDQILYRAKTPLDSKELAKSPKAACMFSSFALK